MSRFHLRNENLRRILALTLVFLMVFTSLPTSAFSVFAEEDAANDVSKEVIVEDVSTDGNDQEDPTGEELTLEEGKLDESLGQPDPEDPGQTEEPEQETKEDSGVVETAADAVAEDEAGQNAEDDDPVTDGGEEQPRGDRTTYDLAGSSPNFSLTSTIKLGGNTIAPGTTVPITDLYDGETFQIDIHYMLPTTGSFTSDDSFVYDIDCPIFMLPGGYTEPQPLGNVTVPDPETGELITVDAGTYTIDATAQTVTFHHTAAFLALNERVIDFQITGTIDLEEVPNGSGDPYVVHLPGDITFEIGTQYEHGLQVEKSAVKVIDDVNNTIKINYTVTVTALEDNTDVLVQDKIKALYTQGNNNSGGSFTISNFSAALTLSGVTSAYNGFTVTTATTLMPNNQEKTIATNSSNKIPVMNKNDVLTFTYTLTYTEPTYETSSPIAYPEVTLYNTCYASSPESQEVNGHDSIEVVNCWIYKSGAWSDSNHTHINWMITVKRGEFQTLEIKDVLGANQSVADNTVVTVYKNASSNTLTGATQLGTYTWADLVSSGGVPLTWATGDETFRIITFQSEKTATANSYSNTAKIISPAKQYTASISGGVGQTTAASKKVVSVVVDDASNGVPKISDRYIHFVSEFTVTVGEEAAIMAENGQPFYIIDRTSDGITSYQMSYGKHIWEMQPTNNSSYNRMYQNVAYVEHNGVVVENPATPYVNVDDATLQFWGCTFDGNQTMDNSNASGSRYALRISFRDNNVVPGTYTFRVKTKISLEGAMGGGSQNSSSGTYVSSATQNIKNAIYWNAPNTAGNIVFKAGPSWTATATMQPATKSCVSHTEANGVAEQVWKITVPNLNFTFNVPANYMVNGQAFNYSLPYTDADRTFIQDTMPNGMELVAAAWNNSDPQPGCTGFAEEWDPGFSSYANRHFWLVDGHTGQSLYIRTRASGYTDPATSSQMELLNRAYIYVVPDDDPYDILHTTDTVWYTQHLGSCAKLQPKTTVTINRPIGLQKSGTYTSATAPYANYTVKINNQALNMIPAFTDQDPPQAIDQHFYMVDSMGSSLQFLPGTLKINANGAGAMTLAEYNEAHPDDPLTLEIQTDQIFRLRGLMDETSYVITYKCVITEPAGTPIHHGDNTVSLPDIVVPGYSSTIIQIGGVSFNITPDPNATIAVVRVHKTDDATPANGLSGAKFKIIDYGVTYDPASPAEGYPVDATELTSGSNGYTPYYMYSFGHVYGIKETTVPSGYSDPNHGEVFKYFVHRASDLTGDYATNVDIIESQSYVLDYVNPSGPVTGALKITKVAEGGSNKTFTFQITLSDTSVNGTYSDVTFTNGVATITLNGGQSKTIEGLPADVTYTVTETNLPGGWSQTGATGNTGTITSGNTVEATFTNTYGVTPTSVTLSGTKSFTGYPTGMTAPTFTYTLSENGSVIQTKTTQGGGNYSFDAIEYTAAGTHTYTVKETRPSANPSNGITYDTHEYTVVVTVTDNGNGTLSTAITVDGAASEGNNLNFTNSYAPGSTSVQFTGLKTFNGPWPSGTTLPTFTYTLTGSGNVNQTKTTQGGGAITFDAITYTAAGTYTYTVSETHPTENPSGGITYDTRTYNITVTVTDNGQGGLVAAISGINEDGSGLNFTNIYAPGQATAQFGGTKTFNAGTYPSGTTQPTFTYILKENGVELERQTTTGSGTYQFGVIAYTTTGTHTYTVEELVPAANPSNGITYDTQVYTVTVVVSDSGNGQLSAAVTAVNANGGSVDPNALNFTNSYESTPTSVQFSGTKTFTGWPANATPVPTFTFTLTGDGITTQTRTTTGNGSFTFDVINYNAPGEYHYTVTETPGNVQGVTYDSTTYNITVTVTDDGQGHLTPVISGINADGSGLNFTNTYGAGPATATLSGHKTFTGWPTGVTPVPTFTYTLSGAGFETQTRTTTGSGDYEFGTLTFTAVGTYNFTVTETRPATNPANGITYDTHEYAVVITVTDPGTGTLAAAITVDERPSDGSGLNFTNSYSSTPISVQFSGTKTFTGWPAGVTAPTFTYTLSENGSVIQTKTTQGAGNYSFDAIEYTAVGTHNYTVVETPGSVDGVTYDNTTYNITVTVTDDGQGHLAAAISGINADGSGLNFTNSYGADPVEVTLGGYKTFTGWPATATQTVPTFTFNLIKDGVTLQTKTTTGSGNYTFDALRFTTVGTYTYTVKETIGNAGGVVYDEHEYTVIITVTDPGTGDLEAAITVDGQTSNGLNLDFTNTYAPGPTTASFGGTKTFTGYPAGATSVPTFTYTLSENGTVLARKTTTGSGDYEFGPINYNEVGTHIYTVEEERPALNPTNGITYDTTTYTVTVTVTDIGSGTLVAAVSATNGSDTVDPDELNFANSYFPIPVPIRLSGTKAFTGPWPANVTEPTFEFTLSENGSVLQRKTTTGSGSFQFDEITYTEVGEHTYTVAETPGTVGGVEYDTTTYTVVVNVTDPGNGTLVATIVSGANADGSGLDFENIYSVNGTSVKFTGIKAFTGPWPADVTAPTFTYTLSEDGTVIQTKTTTGGGAISFDTITYNATGTHHYTVVESVPATNPSNGITYDTTIYNITVVIGDSGNGQLTKTVTVNGQTGDGSGLDFENSYSPSAVPIRLSGTKAFTGPWPANVTEPTFEFTLSENGSVLQRKTTTGSGSFQFDEITYTEVGEHTYTVAETRGTVGGVEYDTTTYTVVVNVTDPGNGTLVATITSGANADGSGLDFENIYSVNGTSVKFTGIKTFTGPWPADVTAPTFTYTLSENGSVIQTKTTTGGGAISFDTITYDATGTHNYTVVESVPATNPSNGITYDTTIYNITVVVSDSGNGQLTRTITVNGQTGDGSGLDFENIYSPAPVKAQFSGVKSFTGWPADVTPVPTFTYTLSENGSVIQTKTTTGGGAITFDEITYTEVSEHTYTVAETHPVENPSGGITYDTRTYTFTVTISDPGNGQLVKTISGINEDGSGLNFSNTYGASPTSIVLSGTKIFTGPWPAGVTPPTFHFVVREGETVIREASTVGGGSFTFDAIEYTEVGEHTYTVFEQRPMTTVEDGITYDTIVYTVVVSVTDDGTGQLTATIVSGANANGSGLDFANSYMPRPVKAQFSGVKSFTGWPADVTPMPEFTYTLSEGGEVIQTKHTTGGGAITFDEITYTETGVHTYLVEEVVGNAGGVTYATNSYTFTVTISDPGNGQLVKTITGDTTTATDLNFTNTYQAKPVSVQFTGLKTLTGKTLTANEFSFTLSGSGVNETVSNNGEGAITFSQITYSTAGTYTYTVTETVGNEIGIVYTTQSYNITVEVTDPGDGQLVATISGINADGSGLNFTNEYVTTSKDGVKTWNDDFDRDGIRPLQITVNLLQNGSVYDSKVITEADDWSYSWSGLPKYMPGATTDNKTEYVYTVSEDDIVWDESVTDHGYTAHYNGMNIENEHAPELIDIPIEKIWDDYNNQYGTRPDSITVNLLADDVVIKTLVLSMPNEVPVEEAVRGLRADDQNDPDEPGEEPEVETIYATAILDEDGNWHYTFENLYKYRDHGTPIVYTITEDHIPAYQTTIVQMTEINEDGEEVTVYGFIITNKYRRTPPPPNDPEGSITFKALKVMEGRDLTAGEFFFELYEGEKLLQKKTNAANGTILFDTINYTKDDVGVHTYTIKEVEGTDPNITYDLTEYEITVTVVDNGGKTLVVTATGTENIKFTNTYDNPPPPPFSPYEEEPEVDEPELPHSPYTGDDRHTAYWLLLSMLSAAGIVALGRKRKEEE